VESTDDDLRGSKAESRQMAMESENEVQGAGEEDFDLSDISHREQSREDIIARAEAAAFEYDLTQDGVK
jgi:hypothetical protein